MIKKFSEEASINNLGSVQYDREQKYMSEKDRAQARDNIGIGEVVKTELEEILFANLPITQNSIRVSFSDKDYDPNDDERKSSFAKMTGTWTKCRTSSANIWDYVHDKTSWENVFYDGTNVENAKHGWFGLPGNFVKIISTDFTGVTSFSRTFSMCHYLTELWSFNNDLTVSNVSYNLTFNKNTYLEKVPDFLDFSNGTAVTRLFQTCISLRKVKEIVFPSIVGGSNAINGTFFGCKSLTTVEKPIDLHNITTHLENFVAGCVSLTHLEFINQPENLILEWAFAGCQSLTSLIQINSKVANAFATYSGYVNAQEQYIMKIPEFPNYDFSETTKLQQMCQNNEQLKVIPELNCPNVTNVQNLFKNCVNVEAGMLRAYTYFKSLGNQITSHGECFTNCGINTESGRIERKYIPQSWGGDGPEE